MVVGEDGTNGGLWCSPVAKTSRPTSSAFSAMATMALIRSRSVGVRPVVGSGVTSPTLKIPNCMTAHPPGCLRFNYTPGTADRPRLFRPLDGARPQPRGLLHTELRRTPHMVDEQGELRVVEILEERD